MKCVICGRMFPDEVVTVKTRGKSKDYIAQIPQELCDYCTSPKGSHRRAQKLPIPDGAKDGCFRLAGAIIYGSLQHYRRLYQGALKEVSLTRRIDGEPVDEFLRYDRAVHDPYYANLTLGKMPELVAYTRRKEDESLSGDLARAAEKIGELAARRTHPVVDGLEETSESSKI